MKIKTNSHTISAELTFDIVPQDIVNVFAWSFPPVFWYIIIVPVCSFDTNASICDMYGDNNCDLSHLKKSNISAVLVFFSFNDDEMTLWKRKRDLNHLSVCMAPMVYLVFCSLLYEIDVC